MKCRLNIKIAVSILFVTAFLSGCSSETKESPEPKAAQLAPEDIVSPIPGTLLVACQSEELFNKLIGHAVRNEKTKFEAMLEDFSCLHIPEGETYKILSVSGGAVEFTNITSGNSNGMWAPIEAFKAKTSVN